MRQALVLALAGEDEGKLLSTVAIGGPAARRLREPGGDESEHVVAGVMAVGVVEALEVIDIDHRNGELYGEPGQGLVQRAPPPTPRQTVTVCHHIRRLA